MVWGGAGSVTDTDVAVGKSIPTLPGLSLWYHLVTAATTNQVNIKAGYGLLRAVHIYNNASYPIYVKFHNTAGTPTAGSGVVLTIGVQAGSSRDFVPQTAREFATGIGMTVVQSITDAGAVALTADAAVIDVAYE
jgi:hypothetical protein